MQSSFTRLGFTALAIVASALPIVAQEAGNMMVVVRDNKGEVITNAKVTISSPTQIGGARTMSVDGTGRAKFNGLYPGEFKAVVEAPGFVSGTIKNIRVTLGGTATTEAKLAPTSVATATVEVLASSAPVVDTTTVTSSSHLTLDTMETLPTGRNYTDFIKFAPGVVANPASGGDFALAGSLSRNNSGDQGARNNTYILDGVDSTNPQSGYALAKFNSEIIQEQEVKVGGIGADVNARGGGAVSNVVTKSGSNSWAGSLNYFFQNNSLYGSRKPEVKAIRGEQDSFTKYDAAFTIGGPIIKDRWWFFTSVKKEVTETKGKFAPTASPVEVAKNAKTEDTLGFFKTQFQLHADHKLELSLTHNDSKDVSLGSSLAVPTQDFDRTRKQDIYSIKWDGAFGDWAVNAKYFGFKNKTEPNPKVPYGNITVIYPDAAWGGVPASGNVPTYQKQAGGLGWYTITRLERDGISLDVTKYQSGWFGDHIFRAGILPQEERRVARLSNSGSDLADYENIMTPGNGPITLTDLYDRYSSSSWAGDESLVQANLATAAQSNAKLMGYFNTLSGSSLDAKIRNAQIGKADPRNAAWGAYQYRIVGTGPDDFRTQKRKALDYYIQDTWTLPENRFVVYAGVRFNKDSYYGNDGAKLHTTELNMAPRLGVTYNHKGEGKLKLFATYGKYFEPIKLDMVNFAGSPESPARLEQIYVAGGYNDWVTLRQRGGRQVLDAIMAPSLQSPYTEEYRFGLQQDLGAGWGWEATYTHRIDRRIIEDFDLHTYTDADYLYSYLTATRVKYILNTMGGTETYWRNMYKGLAIPLSHFGLDKIPADVNYVLANMPGAKRDFDTINTNLKYSSSTWTLFLDYTFIKAKGNSLSSGDADLQGDVPHLDPRLPWMNGYLIGTNDNQFKGYMAYTWQEGWAKGLTLGATYTYLSAPRYSKTSFTYGRQIQGPYFDLFDPEPGARMGHVLNQLDLRAKYDLKYGKIKTEFFLDVFNATNRQGITQIEETVQGISGYRFGQPLNFQAPRRFYLGVRFNY